MEHYKVKFAQEANADIRAAVRYVAVDLRETDTAERMAIRIKEEATSLKDMPERFPLVPDRYLASLGVRMTSVGNYLIFYIVNRDKRQVEISRVLYGKRNLIEILTKSNL